MIACNSYNMSEYSATLLCIALLRGNWYTTHRAIGDLAIPLQAVQYFGDFQQGTLIFWREGAEVLTELDRFFG